MAGTLTVDNANTDTIAGKSNANNMTINAGNITIKGEGSATTNLQQGLAKSFLAYKGNTTNAIYDSINISSVTDVTTGKQTPIFTNNFNGANDYAVAGFGQQDTGGGGRILSGIGSPATNNRPYNSVNAGNALTDLEWVNLSFHGDLA